MLGVIIGVASVVLIISLGRAAERSIASSLDALGHDLVLVYPAPDGRGGGGAIRASLTDRDVDAMQRQLLGIDTVAAQLSGSARIIAGANRADTIVRGVDLSFFDVTPLTIVEGASLRDSDIATQASVIVLGRSTADRLFGDDQAVGRRVRVNGVSATVIGIASTVGSGLSGDQNDFALTPITTARQRLGLRVGNDDDSVGLVLLQFGGEVDLTDARERTLKFLKDRKRISDDETSPFAVSTTEDLSGATSSVVAVVQGVLAAIASISLIVGGIGIMNIMLVSVTERTREIGLRISLGAKPTHIRNQFLTEAAILCGLGGFIGLVLTLAIAFIIAAVSALPISVAPGDALFALATSLLTGLAAGYLPARRAAALDPIEALRSE
ncbi:ABC transporter permease [Sphingomonas sp. 28-62-20]|uniref:ABC transporter permease n=1 Tax=Sphingomonas sp. 28-62-20 TaxID=1970433 RepID=UPI0035A93929